MTRNSILTIAAALILSVGCGDTATGPHLDGGSKADLSAGGGTDMSAAVTTGCNGLNLCSNNCAATFPNDQAGFDMCFATCLGNATLKAKNLFRGGPGSAIGCGQAACLGTLGGGFDGGMPRCKIVMMNGQGFLVNQDGSMLTVGSPCDVCLNNSLATLNMNACNPANDPDCNPPTCVAAANACFADTP